MKLISLILAFSAVVIGAAIPDAGSNAAAGVFICKDADWKGGCQHVAADNKCHNLEDDWFVYPRNLNFSTSQSLIVITYTRKYAVSSIGPDPKVKCTFYLYVTPLPLPTTCN
jgi:hypothetical protein